MTYFNESGEPVLLVRKISGHFVWLTESEIDAQAWRYADLGDNRVSELYEAPVK